MTEQNDTFAAAFETPSKRTGYRLKRLEIKNFGGYHGPASVFHFDLEGAVFSGDNGAGKSTAIDAYRMLFRTQPRFNSATDGAKDRSVETYYVGQYGKKDGAGGGKPEVLRGYGQKKGFMAICGVFMTDTGETFSALRMAYYPKKGESAEWRLVTATGDISIERDFPEWPTRGACARAAQMLDGELHQNYKDFFAAVGFAFGIENPEETANAFLFIDQSIGVKKLGSIATFARENIFPRNSLHKSADGAITAFEEVQESTRQIKRVGDMITSLKGVFKKFDTYQTALASHSEITQRKLHFTQFGHLMNSVRWGRILRRSTARYNEAEADIKKVGAIIMAAEAEIEAIQRKMSNEGYDKVDDLKEEKRKLLIQIGQIQNALKAMTEKFRQAGMSLDASSEASLQASFAKVTSRIADLDKQIAQNQKDQGQADFDLRDATKATQEAASDLANLLRDQSAIDTRLVKARNQIASYLQMRADQMPFVAELAQIRAQDAEWEGVANRILGGIGSQILVESENLAAARRFIKSNRFAGVKVVLHEVKDLDLDRPDNLHRDALAHKIEIKSGDRFENVARALIDAQAGHVCMDAQTFETTRERFAAIKEGSVKNGVKTIKDDRFNIDDRSKYILGWNIQDRIDLAQAKLKEKENAEAKARVICEQFVEGIETLRARRDVATQLIGAERQFSDIDVDGPKAELQSLEAQITALDNGEAEVLRERRMDAKKRKADANNDRDTLISKKGSAEQTMKAARGHAEKAQSYYQDEIEAHGKSTLTERRHYLTAIRSLMDLPADDSAFRMAMVHKETDMDTFIAALRRKMEEGTDSAVAIAKAGDKARRGAEEFMRSFPEADLSTDVIAEDYSIATQANRAAAIRNEWEGYLGKLERDDLPRHKEAFEQRRNTFAIEAVQQIESEANDYARRMKNLQKGFNSILANLTYDPMEGTRARLRIHPRTENEAVQKFRAKLKLAVENIYTDDQEALEKMVQDLIDQIKVEDDSGSAKDRREAILDLRNWFTMDVEEFYVDEAGEYADQRRIYGGQDGASGGQGERLTMLLIGAAMSYTFGAGDEGRQVTGLQTIMLDEAFMHGSEEMAAAATDVLVAMGLQVIAATPVQKLQAFAGKTERVFSISKRKEQILHTDSTYAALEEMEQLEHDRFETRDAIAA